MRDPLLVRAAGLLRESRAIRVDLLFVRLQSGTVQRQSRRLRSEAMEIVSVVRHSRRHVH
jgi:hypothetical protein